MPTDPHEESIIKDQQEPKRISRRQFRKERKRVSRKASRQHYAQLRDQRQKVKHEEEALNDHANYLQQKRLWEEREQRYEIINSVKRRAEEAERKAREVAKQKWRDALLRMPMLPPTTTLTDNYNNASSSSTSTRIQANIRNMPTFVSTKEQKEKEHISSTDIDGDTMNWP
ncbi:hypothetical protein BDA99DRAFT_1657 [Phascolomyces articulosus]|uniref:Uncharacterized protein n=1 Tax=Phascolomyces articulosus TaxID=60185 RepID=A0AAD5KBS7_9FUNG|nr:hypothetical protein BDA99DRAFT_1657 [Phascolomyces articulosus]